MPHSSKLKIAGLTALAAMLSAVGGGAPGAMAEGYRKSSGPEASYRFDRRPSYGGRRDFGRRYDPNNLPSGTTPSDIDLNAPGGPAALFEIIRRNSR